MIIICVAGGSSRANVKFGDKAAINSLLTQLSPFLNSPNIPPATFVKMIAIRPSYVSSPSVRSVIVFTTGRKS